MDQPATVVQGEARGFFGNDQTLRIEERKFDYKTEGGQEYTFFLVVRSRLQVFGMLTW